MADQNVDPSSQLDRRCGLIPWIKKLLDASCLYGCVKRRFLEKDQLETPGHLVSNEKVAWSIPISVHRTHNRNRSLSFTNSDQLVNVNKGSRQIKPVTLGKMLALMIGYQGLLVLLCTV